MKQNDLHRMFQVIQAIEHEDLNNTQYSTKEISQDEVVDTTLYLGTVESRYLTEGYYIFIWMEPYQWVEEMERGYYGPYPKPDLILPMIGNTPHWDQLVLIYKFNKQ